MTSWFNLIAANRIIHRNKLPKWCYWATEIFNNNGNHGHDVWLYYFITALGLCICWAVTKRTWCVAQHAVVGPEGQMALPRSKQACENSQLAGQIRVLMGGGSEGGHSDPPEGLQTSVCWQLLLRNLLALGSPTPKVPKYSKPRKKIESWTCLLLTYYTNWWKLLVSYIRTRDRSTFFC